VAMWLACRGEGVPIQWYHDPTILDKNRFTVAMYLSR